MEPLTTRSWHALPLWRAGRERTHTAAQADRRRGKLACAERPERVLNVRRSSQGLCQLALATLTRFAVGPGGDPGPDVTNQPSNDQGETNEDQDSFESWWRWPRGNPFGLTTNNAMKTKTNLRAGDGPNVTLSG